MRISDWSSDVCASDPGSTTTGSAAVVSDYRFRGVSQTGEEAAMQGSIGISHESGLYAGVWGSSVDLGATDGVLFDDLNTELDAYVGYKREVVPGLTADVGLLYYYYPKDSNIATDYFEPYVSHSGSLGPVNAKEIGRAACRERVCQYVQSSVVSRSLKNILTDTNTKIRHSQPKE